MPVKQPNVRKSVSHFYNRGTARWTWLLAIMLVFVGVALSLPPVLAALTPGTVVVDDKIKVSFSGLRLNRSSNTFDSLATLTNQSTVPIDIPVQLAISTISSSTVTLANATGVQSNGAPYVNVPLSDGILGPGESVSNILLKFNNPQKTAFTFKHSVFGVNHPPVACPADQWLAEYFSNTDLAGTPVLARCEAIPPNYDWGDGASVTGLSVDLFSVRWTGSSSFADGNVTFSTVSDDGVRLYVDGVPVIDNWTQHAATTDSALIPLTAGNHSIVTEFFEAAGGAIAKLSWQERRRRPSSASNRFVYCPACAN